ncbi:DUF397 domain-containing protein [Streptomyces xiaopingdaonensis]|uniref:DUF397 domain-containing protein n=1 Tax=Streptomyces xiaopingdaonensis TaxID=1565415 RepID=UPI00037457AA|nr:DUF397 domain-containing protein [Streptomyces xiaopingdaonensis]
MSTQRVVGAADGELSWFKSSYSGGSGGDCVEVAGAGDAVYVRDTKDRGKPALGVPGGGWSAFVAHLAATAR